MERDSSIILQVDYPAVTLGTGGAYHSYPHLKIPLPTWERNFERLGSPSAKLGEGAGG